MGKPNIILIVLDTLRADKTRSSSKNNLLTPNIYKLLKNSIYFENCIANSPWTLPSHYSMFTGLLPTQIELITEESNKLSIKIPILTEILKELGYFTACFTENAFISKNYGIARGFDIYLRSAKESLIWQNERNKIYSQPYFYFDIIETFLKTRIRNKIFVRFWNTFKNYYKLTFERLLKKIFWEYIFLSFRNKSFGDLDKFTQMLKNNNNTKPNYIFFNIMATHFPYMPINEILRYFKISNKDFKRIKAFLLKSRFENKVDLHLKGKLLSKKKIKILKKLYDASVFYGDLIVKKILYILQRLHIFKNSYIIITSDHGEHLFDKLDHNLWGHGIYLSVYESVMKVPLIIYNMKLKQKIIRNQVQLKDLFHTILHITGVPSSHNRYLNLHKSIIYQVNTKSTPKYIFGEYLKGDNTKNKFLTYMYLNRMQFKREIIAKLKNNIYFLRSNNHKYIYYNKEIEEYFDLVLDPNEQINRIYRKDNNLEIMKKKMFNILNQIKKLEELKYIITEKEKQTINKIINMTKLEGI